jgi:hypothetical protein
VIGGNLFVVVRLVEAAREAVAVATADDASGRTICLVASTTNRRSNASASRCALSGFCNCLGAFKSSRTPSSQPVKQARRTGTCLAGRSSGMAAPRP